MTPTETAAILRKFAQCLRADKYLWGASLPGVSAEVGAAIESAIEIIDRLEAAEKSDAESLAMYRKARDERDALRAALRHEADCVEAAKAEIEALRSKIATMEKQEPVAIVDYKRGSCIRWVEYLGWQKIKDGAKLYALPGAKGE